ncbi:MAG: FHA domain-containing protein, partial [Rhodospirillales bacterium]|nr:FHA domain-containing protein [Rhodospirillales bacterium]
GPAAGWRRHPRRVRVAAGGAARRTAAAAAPRADAAAAEAEAAGEERDTARAEAQAAQTAAEQSQAEREAAEAAAERLARQRRWLAAAGILGLAVAVAVVLLLVQRLRRRRDALSAAEKDLKGALRPAASSCLLDGSDESGRGYAVKLSAEQLGDPSGVVVGRNPAQAGALLAHPEASREHFRLTARDDELVVTDLHSTNGTFVDGERLEAGAEATVADGAEIGVGSAITLRLRIQRTGT